MSEVHCNSSTCGDECPLSQLIVQCKVQKDERIKGESERGRKGIFSFPSHKSIVMRIFTLCALEESFEEREVERGKEKHCIRVSL